MSSCKYCGGSGITKEDPTYCKHCETHAGGKPKETTELNTTDYTQFDLTIPPIYKDQHFDSVRFVNQFSNRNTMLIKNMSDKMVLTIDNLSRRLLPKYSMVFQLAESYQSTLFMYDTLKTCAKAGLTCCNLLTLYELNYLMQLRDTNSVEINSEINNYFTKDFVILYLPRMTYTENELDSLALLLNTRSIYGKTTLICSPVATDMWCKMFPETFYMKIKFYTKKQIDSGDFYTPNYLLPIPTPVGIYNMR